MSKYTTELRYICESYNDNTSSDNSNIDTVISNALPKLFNFSFPIYDEAYRNVLETKIVMHYYTREICCETVGRWKLFLRDKLNLIMPYYNSLYESAELKYNPLTDVDMTTSHTRTNNGTEGETNTNNGTVNSTSADNGNNWNYYSDTPQGGINGLESLTYLTNATNDKINNTTTSSTTNSNNGTKEKTLNNTEDYIEHVTGKSSSKDYSDMLLKYRDTLINIDMMIMNELEDLFFQLW